MDLRAHGRTDLAYEFVNRYLEVSGDYGGADGLTFYLVYRALVRAKVAAIKRAQSAADDHGVERYLASKFGDVLDEARAAMTALARSLPPERLAAEAFRLYEGFRPSVPLGVKGWGAAGVLDLDRIAKAGR